MVARVSVLFVSFFIFIFFLAPTITRVDKNQEKKRAATSHTTMNRSAKRHRSTKVPNVKLRPAPVGVSASHTRRRQEAEAESEDLAHYRQLRRKKERSGKRRANESGEEDDENDDDYDKDDDRGPLLGCVICITGVVEERVRRAEEWERKTSLC